MSLSSFNEVGAIKEKAQRKVKDEAVAHRSDKKLSTYQVAEMSNKRTHPAMKVNNEGQFKGDLDPCLWKKPEAAATN